MELLQKEQPNFDIFDEEIARHKYSSGHINMFIAMILTATGLSCASRVMNIFKSFFQLKITIPSWYAGRLWLLKLGYYKLTRIKEHADDWIWIVDHSIQLGADKCLVILGIRASKLPSNRPLTLTDVEPIELLPVKKSNGDIVYKQLQEAVKKTGVPRAIVGDEGSDLKSGINKFREANKSIAYIHDIKHKVAILLKRALKNDKAWQSFIEHASTTQSYVQQTELAAISPPNQRSKARYMNVDKLVSWGKQALQTIENNEQTNMFASEPLQAKLGWLKHYKNELAEWNNIISTATSVENYVRNNGVFRGMTDKLQVELDNIGGTNRIEKFKENLLSSVLTDESKVHIGETLLGSSEILESLFGKYKNIEQEQASSGFTKLILSIPAVVAETTTTIVNAAMEHVKIKEVNQWFTDNIGCSVQAKRKEVFAINNDRNKNEMNLEACF
jgi:hypothetical protein